MVRQALMLVAGQVVQAMAQHSADLVVATGQVSEPVEVLLEPPRHQNLPQVQPRPPDPALDLGQQVLLQQAHHLRADWRRAEHRLETPQDCRRVVTTIALEFNLLDRLLAHLQLSVVNFSHHAAVFLRRLAI